MSNFRFSNDRPIYLQLVEQLELYLISGKIPPGGKLPSVRELAFATKVNPNTMQRALSELEHLGLIYTERTNGKFVTEDRKVIARHREKLADQAIQTYLDDMYKLGFAPKAAAEYLIIKGGIK